MKKSSRFLIGFAAATLTFGSLFAALGPDKFGGCHSHKWQHHHCESHHHHSCHGEVDVIE